MGLILGWLRLVPLWAYAVAACIAWGGLQKHRATVAGDELRQLQQQVAAANAQALKASLDETQRRIDAQQEVITNANTANARIRADADRLRGLVARHSANAASAPASAGSCAAAESATGMCAQLLGAVIERSATIAEFADRSRAAGQACEAAYGSLTRP